MSSENVLGWTLEHPAGKLYEVLVCITDVPPHGLLVIRYSQPGKYDKVKTYPLTTATQATEIAKRLTAQRERNGYHLALPPTTATLPAERVRDATLLDRDAAWALVHEFTATAAAVRHAVRPEARDLAEPTPASPDSEPAAR